MPQDCTTELMLTHLVKRTTIPSHIVLPVSGVIFSTNGFAGSFLEGSSALLRGCGLATSSIKESTEVIQRHYEDKRPPKNSCLNTCLCFISWDNSLQLFLCVSNFRFSVIFCKRYKVYRNLIVLLYTLPQNTAFLIQFVVTLR